MRPSEPPRAVISVPCQVKPSSSDVDRPAQGVSGRRPGCRLTTSMRWIAIGGDQIEVDDVTEGHRLMRTAVLVDRPVPAASPGPARR